MGLIEVVVGSEEEIGWVMGLSWGDYYLCKGEIHTMTHTGITYEDGWFSDKIQMKVNCLIFTFAVVVGVKAAHRGGFGWVDTSQQSCTSNTHKDCDWVSVNEESGEQEETNECAVQVKFCQKRR